MSKGYDSAERETRERRLQPQICEGYACSELATLTILNRHYCEAHRPPLAQDGAQSRPVAD